MPLQTLPARSRITGARRTELVTEVAKAYASGQSVREISESIGRSYGFVHNLLAESGTERRGRGGYHRNLR